MDLPPCTVTCDQQYMTGKDYVNKDLMSHMGNGRELQKQLGGTKSSTVYTGIPHEHCSH